MITTIISGGQTGADRAGLEAGKDLGLKTGGYVPRGWMTENGPDPSLKEFGCTEFPSEKYPPRTRANVRAADGTVWFGNIGSAGHRCTFKAALDYEKPFLVNPTPAELKAWVDAFNMTILNVAGNRGSKNPAVGGIAYSVLFQAFRGE